MCAAVYRKESNHPQGDKMLRILSPAQTLASFSSFSNFESPSYGQAKTVLTKLRNALDQDAQFRARYRQLENLYKTDPDAFFSDASFSMSPATTSARGAEGRLRHATKYVTQQEVNDYHSQGIIAKKFVELSEKDLAVISEEIGQLYDFMNRYQRHFTGRRSPAGNLEFSQSCSGIALRKTLGILSTQAIGELLASYFESFTGLAADRMVMWITAFKAEPGAGNFDAHTDAYGLIDPEIFSDSLTIHIALTEVTEDSCPLFVAPRMSPFIIRLRDALKDEHARKIIGQYQQQFQETITKEDILKAIACSEQYLVDGDKKTAVGIMDFFIGRPLLIDGLKRESRIGYFCEAQPGDCIIFNAFTDMHGSMTPNRTKSPRISLAIRLDDVLNSERIVNVPMHIPSALLNTTLTRRPVFRRTAGAEASYYTFGEMHEILSRPEICNILDPDYDFAAFESRLQY